MTELNTAEYLEELAQTLASHGSNLAALRMAELEQKVSPSLAWPGVPSAQAGGGGSLAGVNTAYAPTVAMGAAGLFVTDGAIQVTNAGSTVIIDGTSNMFKIAATGTQTLFVAATATLTSTYTTLTGLGVMSVTPGHQSYVSDGSASTALKNPGAYAIIGTTKSFLRTYTNLDGSGYVRAGIEVNEGFGFDTTFYQRFYVLKEAAM